MIPERQKLDLTTRRRSVRRGYLWLLVLPFLLYLGGMALFPLLRLADQDAPPVVRLPSSGGSPADDEPLPWKQDRASRRLVRPDSAEADRRRQRPGRAEDHLLTTSEEGFEGAAPASRSRGVGSGGTGSGAPPAGMIGLDEGAAGPSVLGAMGSGPPRRPPSGSLEAMKWKLAEAFGSVKEGMRSMGLDVGDKQKAGGAAGRGAAPETGADGSFVKGFKAGQLEDSQRGVRVTISERDGSLGQRRTRPVQELQGIERAGRAAGGAPLSETAAAFASAGFEGQSERERLYENDPETVQLDGRLRPKAPQARRTAAEGTGSSQDPGWAAFLSKILSPVVQPSMDKTMQGGQPADSDRGPCNGMPSGSKWRGGCCCTCVDPAVAGPGC